MPRGNGTGPQGMGPMTGRAAGYCAGYANPGYTNYAPGRGFGGGWGRGNQGGYGRGRGYGWGFQNAYPYTNATDEAYRVSILEQQARYLEDSLEGIRKELAEAKGRKGTD